MALEKKVAILKKDPYRSFLTGYEFDKSCVELHFPIANTDRIDSSPFLFDSVYMQNLDIHFGYDEINESNKVVYKIVQWLSFDFDPEYRDVI